MKNETKALLNALWVTLLAAAYLIGTAALCIYVSWWFASVWALVPAFLIAWGFFLIHDNKNE